jgi:hypothetical protein
VGGNSDSMNALQGLHENRRFGVFAGVEARAYIVAVRFAAADLLSFPSKG